MLSNRDDRTLWARRKANKRIEEEEEEEEAGSKSYAARIALP